MAANSHSNFLNGLRGSGSSTPTSTKTKKRRSSMADRRLKAQDMNKENIARASSDGKRRSSVRKSGLTSDSDVVKKKPKVEHPSAVFKKGLCDTPTAEEGASLIRERALQDFDQDHVAELQDLCTIKVKTNKFDMKSTSKAQGAVIVRFRKFLTTLRNSQSSFIKSAVRIEERLNMESASLTDQINAANKDKEDMESEMTNLRNEMKGKQTALVSAGIEGDALREAMETMAGKHGALEASLEQARTRATELESELVQMTQLANLKKSELEQAHAELENKKTQMAEMQVTHRNQEIANQQQFNDSLDKVRAELVAERTQKEGLQLNKRELETQVQGDAVRLAILAGEVARAEANADNATKDYERSQKEVGDLQGKLHEKAKEVMVALESFNKSQRFNEERTQTLCNEKREVESKLTAALTQKVQLEEQVRNVTASRDSTAATLASTEQTLQEERLRLTNEVSALRTELEVARSQHASMQTNLEEKIKDAADKFDSAQSEWNAKEASLTEQATQLTSTLQQTQEELASLQATSTATITDLTEKNTTLTAGLEEAKQTVIDGMEQAEQASILVAAGHKEALAALESAQAEQTAVIDTLDADIATLNGEKAELTAQFDELKLELATFKKHAGDTEQLENLVKVSMEVDLLRGQLSGKENLAQLLTEARSALDISSKKLYYAEITRRELHNKIQEMKGNVRVYVRCRPFLGQENASGNADKAVKCSPDLRNLQLTCEGKESRGEKMAPKDYPFAFDHIFGPETQQEDVFQEVSSFVQSALDGYNVCLFSYGQTGSGKTFSMQGSDMGVHRGIIPRSVEKIMEEAKRLEGDGWTYTLEATFMEIYNETVRDLLGSSKEVSKGGLAIKMDSEGSAHVPGLNRCKIENQESIELLMKKANKKRSVAHTDMNSQSSRSHSVFTLHLIGHNEAQGVVVKGCLNLCDLAGSERLSRSGATGDRLKETQAINKSLSAISDIFQALSKKASHIPYRNTKLTHILHRCFSEQGKTLMMVNLSPSMESAGESLCSLRFAEKVNNTEMGRPGKKAKNVKRISASTKEGGDKKRARR